ncbi:alpha/beta hydrolase domain-containing protein [Nocardioides dilutus]
MPRRLLSPRPPLPLTVVLVLVLVGSCSTGTPEQDEGSGSRVSPLTGGNGIFLASSSDLPALPDGWVEEELALSGSATTYTSEADLPADGRFDLRTAFEEPYATRVVVRRPPERDFNGTVVVEWLNVSGGFDAHPDYTYLADEILRGGYAWIGVSAQYVGIEGGPVAVSTPVSAAAGAGKGLRAMDPERYGHLHHPGDAFSYDIYTQAAAAARSGELVGGLEPDRVLAVGQSQSGFALTTYANGVQPLTGAFDGFLIHSRGGATAPLGVFDAGIDIAATLAGPPTVVRDDLEVPVLTLESESDVVGVLDYLPARQPDSDRFRLWEVAGTAHADRFQVGPLADALGCPAPVNDGPQHLVAKAALRALDVWVRDGVEPPSADRLATSGSAYERDRDGIVEGGIRTPLVDVPVDVLSGDPAPDGPLHCLLFGTTTPLPDARLAELYADRAAYVSAFEGSADAAIAAGFVLPEDRESLLDYAEPERLAG